MRKYFYPSLLIIVAIIFITLQSNNLQEVQNPDGFYSKEAKTVIDNKCYGCHSIKGKSQDAKDALMWDSLPGLQKAKMVATLDEIIEVLEEDKMPPEAMVKKMPEMKLLADEKKILLNWAENKAESLLK